jgi:hypothetical protein
MENHCDQAHSKIKRPSHPLIQVSGAGDEFNTKQ